MLWLNPSALFALAAVAAPILIHILIQRRAERFPFPTLRFLRPTRLAAIRRHLLEDLPLLAVRMALLAAAVVALAGPLFVTAARRSAWDRRVVRAVVTSAASAPQAPGRASPETDAIADERRGERPALQQRFEASSLSDGIRRASVWLDAAPPARREIVIASPLPIGSITPADIAAVPAGIGIRFERTDTLPSTRTIPAGRVLTATGVRAREVTLTADQTALRDIATGDPMVWPIDVESSTDEQPAIDAAVAAVLSQRVWAAPPDRRARLVLAGTPDVVPALPIAQPWMAAAVVRIAEDADLHAAAARVAAGLRDTRFSAAPYEVLASAADGRPLAAATGSANRLVVVSAAPASDVATPVLLRAIANAIAGVPDLQRAEVLPIADAVLQRWSRPSAPMTAPRIETVDQDDRRWLWGVVLCLLALESWIRRARSDDVARERQDENARVA